MPPTGTGSEHWHQATFISIIRKVDHVAGRRTYATPNGFLRTKAMRLRAWQEGAVAGVWDIHNPYPAKGHPGQYIEFKVGKNTLSREQVAFRDDMLPLGYRMDLVYSWQEALTAWADYLDLDITFS